MEDENEGLEAVLAEREWWRKLSSALGWGLFGWNGKSVATFKNKQHKTVEIRGTERNDIMALIADYECLVAKLREENERLRRALIEAGRNAGCLLADNVSTDFLIHVPGEIAALRKRLSELEWTPITPESVPQDGDELLELSGVVREVGYSDFVESDFSKGFDFEAAYREGWTHYRPIKP